jgi:hypothetical protein
MVVGKMVVLIAIWVIMAKGWLFGTLFNREYLISLGPSYVNELVVIGWVDR